MRLGGTAGVAGNGDKEAEAVAEQRAGRPEEIQVKIPDDLVAGTYSNMMGVQHSVSEFVMDYAFVCGGVGKVVARVITNPSHMKRIVNALQENLARYESAYGKIKEAGRTEVKLGFQPPEE